MSKAILTAVGGILTTFLVQGEYRNLAFTGAAALTSWKAFGFVHKQEQEEAARLFSPVPATLPPIQFAAAQAQSTTQVVVEGATIHNHLPAPSVTIAPQPAGYETAHPSTKLTGDATVTDYGDMAVTRTALEFDVSDDEPDIVQDIPLLLAESIASGTNPGHLLVSSKTGSGKTFFIKSLMRRLYELEGNGFIVIDPKGSQWMGLDRVFRIRSESDSSTMLTVVKRVLKILQARIADREKSGDPTDAPRITLILDEWPTLLDMAKAVKLDTELMTALNAIVRLGREDRVNLWLMGQSHLVSEAGFSRTTQNNFELVALGRGDQLQSVRAIISDQWVIQDRKRRQTLNAELEQLDPDGTPIAFTSAGGGRLCKLPDLSEFVQWEIPGKEGNG